MSRQACTTELQRSWCETRSASNCLGTSFGWGLKQRMKCICDALRCEASSASCTENLATTPEKRAPRLHDMAACSAAVGAKATRTRPVRDVRSGTSRSSGQRSLFLERKPEMS